MQKQQGFTILELMIVIAILGVLAAIALPSFQSSIENASLNKAASTFESALELARIKAIENNKRTVACPVANPNATSCGTSGDWGKQIIVFIDENSDGIKDANEELLGSFDMNSNKINTEISNTTDWIGFLGGGTKAKYSRGIAPTVTFSSKKNASRKVCMKLNMLGRVARDEQC